MTWGAVYRTRKKVPERGHKPGFYVVVSRDFAARSDDISTVVRDGLATRAKRRPADLPPPVPLDRPLRDILDDLREDRI